MKNKKHYTRSGRKQSAGARIVLSVSAFHAFLRMLKDLAPRVAKAFVYCLFICIGFFSAAVLGALCLKAESLPLWIYAYAIFYFCGLTALIAAEYFTKKNKHFFAYASITASSNFALICWYKPELLQNFFANLLPQTLLFTAGVFLFYRADYKAVKPDTFKKRKQRRRF